jgi:hypothetical protein
MKNQNSCTRAVAGFLTVVACVLALKADAQPETTPAGIRLIGTVEGTVFAGAVFDDGSGQQTFVRVRDKLPDGSQIVKVFDDRILLRRPDGSFVEMYKIQNMKDGASPQRSVSAPASASETRADDRQAVGTGHDRLEPLRREALPEGKGPAGRRSRGHRPGEE